MVKIEYYERIKEDVHPGTIIGSNGEPIEGMQVLLLRKSVQAKLRLQPLGGIGEALGGYKGYGFAMAVELFSAMLQDGEYGKHLTVRDENGNIAPYHLGHYFIAIDTEHFLGEDIARKKAGEIIRSVRNSKKAPDAERIYTAGEKEYEIWKERENSGVPITDAVQQEIIEIRNKLYLDYVFPLEEGYTLYPKKKMKASSHIERK